jgi:hypothetical protein
VSIREIRVLALDVFELCLDEALDSAVFAAEMLQLAGQNHPGLLLSGGAFQPRDLLCQCLLHKLLERTSLDAPLWLLLCEKAVLEFRGSSSRLIIAHIYGSGQGKRRTRFAALLSLPHHAIS